MTIPILDSLRTGANSELGRVIIDYFGTIEPAIDEIDSFCAMPLRLVHNAAMGFGLEVGPYDLCSSDIDRLRKAIAAYDAAVGG
jgi:hypothetical protein